MYYYIIVWLLICIGTINSMSLDKIEQETLRMQYYILKHDGRSYIAFMKDKNGVMYIVKQYLKKGNGSFCVSGQFRSVREIFGARLAQLLGLKAHNVCVIPKNIPFVGKRANDSIATLHSFVPGIPLNKSKFKSVYIKQWAPGKGVPDKNIGLSEEVIRSMSVHTKLPIVVAFDTLVANNDRSRNNIFHDEHTDDFYLIDMDRALVCNMAEIAYQQLSRILLKQDELSRKEIKALRLYRNALETFTTQYSCKQLCVLYDAVCAECGFVKNDVFSHGLSIVKETRKIIKKTYASVLKVIELLNVLE